jgi:hypothetical protein
MLLRIVQLHVRVSEVELEPGLETTIPGAAGDFRKRVIFQRVDAAEAASTGSTGVTSVSVGLNR